ncbi:nitroreductase family protein [Hydrogenophaga sp. OTU3427]|uniref:nitroreductase family protein n=1 Tax=Hydrogenophaga sp. OTU3427 TaxID=3043856 RepID=UPI00313EE221
MIDRSAPDAPLPTGPEHVCWAETLLHSRRTTLPKRLRGPGPDAAQQAQILRAAAAAPDHGQLLPWRFIEVPEARRSALAAAFAQALHERDPLATAEERQQAGDKAFRSPWLLLAVCAVRGGDPEVPAQERLLSAGCALQNMLLMATAMGFGSALTSGKAMQSAALRTLFALGADEDALCFLNVGQVIEPRRPRPRPSPETYFSRLG